MFKRLRRASAKNAILIALGILCVYILSLRPLTPFQVLTLKMDDLFFLQSFRFRPLPKELEDIVLVALDDESYAKMNKRWPWERSVYAELTEKISRQAPRLILLDVAFGGASGDPRNDVLLTSSLQNAGNVLIAYHLGDYGETILPLEQVRKAALDYGYVNKPLDPDFAIRRAYPCQWTVDGKLLEIALEVKAASHLFHAKVSHLPQERLLRFERKGPSKETRFRGAGSPMPLHRDRTVFLNYQARRENFKTVPVWKVFSEEVPPDLFKDKIVLFGITNRLMHDIHNTPLGVIPGVFIVANFLLMILNGGYVTEAPLWLNLVLLVLAGLGTAYATYRFSLWRGFLFLFYEVVVLLGITFYLYLNNIHWDFANALIAISLSYLGVTFYKYLCLLFENISLKEEAITDGLTQLYTYRYFELRLRNEFERAARYRASLSLAFIDIDHFKRINDTYGHEEGNLVLKMVAEVLKKNTRRIDLVARYGGEEFCVVLPQTDLEGARQYAENVRKMVEDIPFLLRKTEPVKVTISIGVCSYPQFKVPSGEALTKLTDQALYQAKQSGRNRVCIPNSPLPV